MNGLRLLGRVVVAVARALWTGDLATKLFVLVALAIGVSFIGSAAGPATTGVAQLLVVVAFLFAIYSLLLRR